MGSEYASRYLQPGGEKNQKITYNYPMKIIILLLFLCIGSISQVHASGAYPLSNPPKEIIGFNQVYVIQDKETLLDLALQYDVGYNEIVAANSHIDPWIPDKGEHIVIPTSWIIPERAGDGILINLAEMRLYYFLSVNGETYVKTYPLGIGRAGFNTPTGVFRVTGKAKDPVWRVPETIREESPELPRLVPPGPANPLGGYWLQLSINGYGIHGTNRPYGIGRRVSHGCIRLYPQDIAQLFGLVKPGTVVKIINDPVKIALRGEEIYIEVHRGDKDDGELLRLAVQKIKGKNLLQHADTELIRKAVKRATGLPTLISR